MTFVIREAGGVRFTEKLVLGTGLSLNPTAEGAPELAGGRAGELLLLPSGKDDTARIQAALNGGTDVRLAPGLFTISSQINVGTTTAGTGQRLLGSGVARTRVELVGFPSQAIQVRASHSGVEDLTLEANSSVEGIRVAVTTGSLTQTTGVVIRNVRIETVNTGIWLENAVAAVVENVQVTGVAAAGIYAQAIGASDIAGLVIRNVRVECTDGGPIGVALVGISGASVSGVVVRLATSQGVWVQGGAGVHVSGVRLYDCGIGVSLQNTSGTVVEGVDAVYPTGLGSRGILVDGSREVTLSSVRVSRYPEPMVVTGSENVVAGALRLDISGGSPNPHLRVTSSPRVFVTSLTVVSAAVTQVDVAAAGSRVLFGPTNVTLVNSGGFYAAL